VNALAPTVSDSMLSKLPEFCNNLRETFPDHFADLTAAHILPGLYSLVSCAAHPYDLLAETIAAILMELPMREFVAAELPKLTSLCQAASADTRHFAADILMLLADRYDPVWSKELINLLNSLLRDGRPEIRARVPELLSVYLPRSDSQRLFVLVVRRLGRDESAEVRKAMADCLVDIANGLDDYQRVLVLPPMIESLLDDSEEIRSAVASATGRLISTLGDRTSARLVGLYGTALSGSDPDAAFVFPAVALALGRGRWPELRPSFCAASRSPVVAVRRPLAYGLSSFCFVMPPDELRDAMHLFLADDPAVARGVIASLFQFLPFLGEERDGFLTFLSRHYDCWRIRLDISQQVRYCSEYIAAEHLFPIAAALAVDPVAAVRRDAAFGFAQLMSDADWPVLEQMAASKWHYVRQSAARICGFLSNAHTVKTVRIIKALCTDPVANVRVVAAEVAVEIAARGGDVDGIITEIERDPDPDVKATAHVGQT
jgi:HEAT repeat protein